MSTKVVARPQGVPEQIQQAAPEAVDPQGTVLRAFLESSEDEARSVLGQEHRQGLEPLLWGLRAVFRSQQARLASVLEISTRLGSSTPQSEVLEAVMAMVSQSLSADRSSLFLVEPRTGQLASVVSQGFPQLPILLDPGEGFAGWCAQTGQGVNVRDAYRDPRFNVEFDALSGYATQSVLCEPLRSVHGHVLGVIQVLNSQARGFGAEDEVVLRAIATQAAVALENGQLYRSMRDKQAALLETQAQLESKIARLDLLYDVAQTLGQHPTLEAMAESITRKTLELTPGGLCALTLVEPGSSRMFVHAARGEGLGRVVGGRFYARTLGEDAPLSCEVVARGEPLARLEGANAWLPGPGREEPPRLVDSALVTPLWEQGQCIGSLGVYDLALVPGPGTAEQVDELMKLLALIAQQIASSVAARRREERQAKEERLATIGHMLSGILHDFRSPLAAISGYVQLMARCEDPARRQDYARATLRHFAHVDQMSREMLAFARGERELLVRRVLVGEFAREVGELIAPELQERAVQLRMDVRYRGYWSMDPVKIKRAIVNLARNAAEAMHAGGLFELGIRAEGDPRAPEALVLSFADSGHGVPESVRDTLFESFVTAGKPGGTGLGLAVVHRIVAEHGGAIAFESRLGQGTTFTIRLPLLQRP